MALARAGASTLRSDRGYLMYIIHHETDDLGGRVEAIEGCLGFASSGHPDRL